jgi:hypothetical protein
MKEQFSKTPEVTVTEVTAVSPNEIEIGDGNRWG